MLLSVLMVASTVVAPLGLAAGAAAADGGTDTTASAGQSGTATATGSDRTGTLSLVAETTRTGVFENAAAVTPSHRSDRDATNDTDGATVTVTEPTADLAIDKSVDDRTPRRGDTINFTLSLTNEGPDDATGVTVADSLPSGLTFVNASGDGSYDAGAGAWSR